MNCAWSCNVLGIISMNYEPKFPNFMGDASEILFFLRLNMAWTCPRTMKYFCLGVSHKRGELFYPSWMPILLDHYISRKLFISTYFASYSVKYRSYMHRCNSFHHFRQGNQPFHYSEDIDEYKHGWTCTENNRLRNLRDVKTTFKNKVSDVLDLAFNFKCQPST